MRRKHRTGLRTRLVAFCAVIAAVSIGTTAWIAAVSASSSIRDEYTENVASAAAIHDALSGYAATHPSWSKVGPTGAALARRYAVRVTLVTQSGRTLFDSQLPSTPVDPDARPAATIDPLEPDRALSRTATVGGIDPRAVGPFALTSTQRSAIDARVEAARTCYTRRTGAPAPAAGTYPNGRKYLRPDQSDADVCLADLLPATAGERAAATALLRSVRDCLDRLDTTPSPGGLTVALPPSTSLDTTARRVLLDPARPDFQNTLVELASAVGGQVEACVAAARRAQLEPYVAEPAQLYLSGSDAFVAPGLSARGVHRILLGGCVVLAATVGLCVVAATGLRRPLAALTTAVQATAAGARGVRLPARGTREMAELASAVNDLSAQLADADRRRQDMIGDVAHELRTPLANLRGWLEAIQDGVTPRTPALVESLLEEAMLLQVLVDDLQDLALADAGQLVMHHEPVDVADVARQVVDAARVAAAPATVSLDVAAAGDTVLSADPARLRQVVGNLVSNAVRYTDHGSVRVTVTGDPGLVAIEVADTGRGIAAADLPHLFDRFWRADHSRSRVRGGSGLGLAITQHLVHAHGGTIAIRSRQGEGTTVTVQLPRA